ncbi:septum formation family protein [Micromonospora echinospora]|uniref:septum formation family protein n=1 Tax=Micromonospora echinospora TaxID=1877 RepID=UPI00366F70C6
MRRWLRASALLLVAGLAVTGCGGPAGSDGDLTDDWPAVAAPAPFEPESGVCHPALVPVGYLSSYGPVPCDQWHSAETVHVGTLPAEHTDRSTPPPVGSPARKVAYAECEKAANRALGADWRSGRIRLSVVLPSEYGWRGGARWFRCDVSEIYGLNNTAAKPRTASLKGSLTGAAPLAHRCFVGALTHGRVTTMDPVGCTARHNAEFVGTYQDTSASHAAMAAGRKQLGERCLALIAAYTKVPDDGDLEYRTGWLYYHPDEQQWRDGNRGVQCFLWLNERGLTRSVRGGGTRALPVR